MAHPVPQGSSGRGDGAVIVTDHSKEPLQDMQTFATIDRTVRELRELLRCLIAEAADDRPGSVVNVPSSLAFSRAEGRDYLRLVTLWNEIGRAGIAQGRFRTSARLS